MAQTHSLDLELSSSQSATITDASQTGLDITGDLTIEAWIKLESVPSSSGVYTIASKWSESSPSNQRSYWFRYRDDAGTLKLQLNTSSNGSGENLGTVSIDLVAARWYHVAVSYDASAGTCEFYVDGRNVGSGSSLATSLHSGSAPFEIGVTEATRFFDGLVKDVRVFDDIRTAAEIAADAAAESVSNANLQAEWNFNNAATDSSGNGNTLTLNGSPVYSTDIPWEDATQVSGSTYLETNLQGYWTFDDVLTDSTSNNNDLTDNNTVGYAAGVINNGMDLESTNSEYASIADGSQTGLDITGDLSVSTWLNFEGTGANMSIVVKNDNDPNLSYEMQFRTGSGIRLATSSDGSSSGNATVSWSPSTSTLYHMVLSYDASAGEIELFIDGISLGRATGTLPTSISNGGATFAIGSLSGGGDYFDGVIDEFSIYSRYLHYGDVIDLYNSGSGITFEAADVQKVSPAINSTGSFMMV